MNLQPHIAVSADDIASKVIVCGDPARAARIAAWCENGKQVASNREFQLFNARFNGIDVTICSTGIGAASMLIALEELKQCGVTTIIRVGSAGALQHNIGLGELIIAEGAVRDEGGSLSYLPASYPAVADHALVAGLLSAAKQLQSKYYLGLVRSHDSFYTDQETEICEFWHQRGVLAADMETSALLTVGRFRGLQVASILNNVVLFEQEVKEGIGQFKQVNGSMIEGEKRSAMIALQALTSHRS